MHVLYTAPQVDRQALESLAELGTAYEALKTLAYHADCLVSLQQCKASGQLVALKSYSKGRMSSVNTEQVNTELQIHSSLLHDHVAPLLFAVEDDRCIHMAVQWADGGDLREHLRGMGERAVREVVVRPLLQALVVLEQQGVVHRDLKPENVLVHRGRVQLADFGLAVYTAHPQRLSDDGDGCEQQQHGGQPVGLSEQSSVCPASPSSDVDLSCLSSPGNSLSHDEAVSTRASSSSASSNDLLGLSRASCDRPGGADGSMALRRPVSSPDLLGAVSGTPLYTAPEVLLAMFQSKPVDQVVSHKNDIWALGVMALEALTGSHPLSQSHNLLCSVAYHTSFNLPSSMSPAAADFVSKATHKDPAQRPSASQLLAHAWLQNGSDSTCSSPTAQLRKLTANLHVAVRSPAGGRDTFRSPHSTPHARSCKSACLVSPRLGADTARPYEPDCWEY